MSIAEEKLIITHTCYAVVALQPFLRAILRSEDSFLSVCYSTSNVTGERERESCRFPVPGTFRCLVGSWAHLNLLWDSSGQCARFSQDWRTRKARVATPLWRFVVVVDPAVAGCLAPSLPDPPPPLASWSGAQAWLAGAGERALPHGHLHAPFEQGNVGVTTSDVAGERPDKSSPGRPILLVCLFFLGELVGEFRINFAFE